MIFLLFILVILLIVLLLIKPKKFNNYNLNITLPLDIILDGNILYENLDIIKKDYNWLIKTLNKKGINSVENINNAVLDSSGVLRIEEYKL